MQRVYMHTSVFTFGSYIAAFDGICVLYMQIQAHICFAHKSGVYAHLKLLRSPYVHIGITNVPYQANFIGILSHPLHK